MSSKKSKSRASAELEQLIAEIDRREEPKQKPKQKPKPKPKQKPTTEAELELKREFLFDREWYDSRKPNKLYNRKTQRHVLMTPNNIKKLYALAQQELIEQELAQQELIKQQELAKRELAKQQELENQVLAKQELAQFSDAVSSWQVSGNHELDITPKFASLFDVIEVVLNNTRDDKHLILNIDDFYYTLTPDNKKRLIRLIKEDLTIPVEDVVKSDVVIVGYMMSYGYVNLLDASRQPDIPTLKADAGNGVLNAQINNDLDSMNPTDKNNVSVGEFLKKRRTRDSGAYFPFHHKLDMKLDRFGIFKDDGDHYEDNCLIVALRNGGMEEQKLQSLKLCINVASYPICKLKQLCEENGFRIKLNNSRKSLNQGVYGTTGKLYELGLLAGHYFIIEQVKITKYALENYFELKQKYKSNFNDMYRMGKRDKTRYINSFNLISHMLEDKEKYLVPITINYKSLSNQYKVDVISTLSYEEIEAVEFEYKEPIETDKDIRFFDFETFPEDIEENNKTEKRHIAYTCSYSEYPNFGITNRFRGDAEDLNTRTFSGYDCAKKMLDSLETDTLFYAHNARYDFNFVFAELSQIKLILSGKSLVSCDAVYHNKRTRKMIKIQIKDSYKLISKPLRKFGEMFQLQQEKEIMPYGIYNRETVDRKWIPIEEVVNLIEEVEKKDDFDTERFLKNCERWRLIKDGKINILAYSELYCRIDCEVLLRGFMTFRQWMIEATGLYAENLLTISSLAKKYLEKEGAYDGTYKIAGAPRAFIARCVSGGRTMTNRNQKYELKEPIEDFDGVSLYPSACVRLGFLLGKPKVLTNLTYEFLQRCDGYFVKINITAIGINRAFPLMSQKNDAGIRMFENTLGHYYVDKVSLEDLIEFQQIRFEIIEGYYYDEGRNYKIQEIMNHLFNERINKKKKTAEYPNGNPIQEVYKLIMNSAYGSNLLKPINTKHITCDDRESFEKFMAFNYNTVKQAFKTPCGKYVIDQVKAINRSYNNCQIGCEILSMSKRIMNEVICTAEDSKIDIFYQDTDSLHMKKHQIETLRDVFNAKYGRELIGKKLGQFHSDFQLEYAEDKMADGVYAIETILLGKKSYIDRLIGKNKDGAVVSGIHYRMKGVPQSTVKHTANKRYAEIENEDERMLCLYRDLLVGEEIEFDLLEEGTRCAFQQSKGMTVSSVSDFKRKLKF